MIALAWSMNVVSFLDVKNLALWTANVVLWAWQGARGIRDYRGFRDLAPCWGILALLSGIGLNIAPVPQFVLVEALRIAGLLLFASQAHTLLRGASAERSWPLCLALVGLACAILALLQRAGALSSLFPVFPQYTQPMYSVFGNQGLLGGFLAMSLTALLPFLAKSRGIWSLCLGVAATLLFAALVLAASRAAVLALGAGVLCLLALRRLSWRQAGILMLAAATVTGCCAYWGRGELIARWAGAHGAADTGGQFRPWLWRAGLDMIADQPLLGHGMGNFVYAAPVYLGRNTPPGGLGELVRITTYHAHGDLLEFICENGLLGLAALLWVAARLRCRAPAALACLVSLGVFSCFHPAWASTPHALVGLLCYAQNVGSRPPINVRPAPRMAHGLIGAMAAAGCALFMAFVLYPSVLLRRAEDRHLAGQPAGEAYEMAAGVCGAHPEAHESRGIYAFEKGDFALAWREFTIAKSGLDTGRICQLLAMTASARGDVSTACDWYTACLVRWPEEEDIREAARAHCGPRPSAEALEAPAGAALPLPE